MTTKHRVTIEHDGYGCESGCCGHRIVALEGDVSGWVFDHRVDDESEAEFARRVVAEVARGIHVDDITIDLEGSEIKGYWC